MRGRERGFRVGTEKAEWYTNGVGMVRYKNYMGKEREGWAMQGLTRGL